MTYLQTKKDLEVPQNELRHI